jgi:hypothetical protein
VTECPVGNATILEISEGVPSARVSKKLQVKPESLTLAVQLDTGAAVARDATLKTPMVRSRSG